MSHSLTMLSTEVLAQLRINAERQLKDLRKAAEGLTAQRNELALSGAALTHLAFKDARYNVELAWDGVCDALGKVRAAFKQLTEVEAAIVAELERRRPFILTAAQKES